MKDPYDTLGVPKDADKATIRKAFQRLAKKAHPDRKGGSVEQMQEVNSAYRLLSSDTARAHYDKTGGVPPVDELENAARQCLMTFISAVFDNAPEEAPDVVGDIRQAIRANVVQNTQNLTVEANKRRRLEKNRKKFKLKKEGTFDFVEMLYQEKLRHSNANTANLERTIQVLNRALELLDLFESVTPGAFTVTWPVTSGFNPFHSTIFGDTST